MRQDDQLLGAEEFADLRHQRRTLTPGQRAQRLQAWKRAKKSGKHLPLPISIAQELLDEAGKG